MPDSASLAIGLLTHSVNPRGGVVHTLELAEALRLRGHRVTVIATARPGQRFFRPVASEVALIDLPGEAHPDMVQEIGTRIARTEQYLRQHLAQRSFDILHAQDPIGGNALANLRDQARIAHFVRTVHHLDHFSEPQLDAWQTRGYQAADLVLCVSAMWQERLLQEHGQASGLVHNGVDTRRYTPQAHPDDEALRRRLGIRADGRVVLSIGGIEERKNTVRLLQAFIPLRDRMPDAQLVIAGGASLLDHSGSARAFHALLARHGMAHGPGQPVLITGPLPDDDIPGLLRLADVTAMPSLREGFGLVVLESLACGTPVVVSRIRPFIDYLAPGDACWADPMSPSSIEQALEGALAETRPAQVEATARRLSASYAWDASARQHLAHYGRLLQAELSAT
ncbi:MAG TPA: MSMEG_0565 family glycosyltransferase [Bordetella sp.]